MEEATVAPKKKIGRPRKTTTRKKPARRKRATKTVATKVDATTEQTGQAIITEGNSLEVEWARVVDTTSSGEFVTLDKPLSLQDIYNDLYRYLDLWGEIDLPTMMRLANLKNRYNDDPVLAWRHIIVVLEGVMGKSLRVS